MLKLRDKIAVITGGSSGIGLATAKRFVAEGATVIITGRRKDGIEDAIAEIGGNVEKICGDIANLADIDRLYTEVRDRHGRIDVLFANAGAGQVTPFAAVTEENFDMTVDTNFKGTFFTIQKLLPLMPDAASIIINASIVTGMGAAGFSTYAASKAAIRSLARTLTTELKARKIRVNAVSPGTFVTPLVAAAFPTTKDLDAFVAHRATTIPLGRVGETEEVAAALLFLASSESSYITGTELAIDGGVSQV
ncbi:SDR family oxidoreductase [Neorhizobium sp. DAR64861/K0K2]|uniref:SDR family oxidoreductase n=1 Tax=unclassified Neorhizobium TaxID=2629175 RepID=UPI003D2DB41F